VTAPVRRERKRENKTRGNWGKKMAVAPPRPPPAFSRFLPSFSQFALSPLLSWSLDRLRYGIRGGLHIFYPPFLPSCCMFLFETSLANRLPVRRVDFKKDESCRFESIRPHFLLSLFAFLYIFSNCQAINLLPTRQVDFKKDGSFRFLPRLSRTDCR